MRHLAKPRTGDELRLKRAVRYLRGKTRLVLQFPWHQGSAHLTASLQLCRLYLDAKIDKCWCLAVGPMLREDLFHDARNHRLIFRRVGVETNCGNAVLTPLEVMLRQRRWLHNRGFLVHRLLRPRGKDFRALSKVTQIQSQFVSFNFGL